MQTIEIHSGLEDSFNGDYWLQGVFLHGDMERAYGYDLFSFDREITIHGPTIIPFIDKKFNKQCLAFIWEGDKFNKYRGLVVFVEDKDGVIDALDKFNNKKKII